MEHGIKPLRRAIARLKRFPSQNAGSRRSPSALGILIHQFPRGAINMRLTIRNRVPSVRQPMDMQELDHQWFMIQQATVPSQIRPALHEIHPSPEPDPPRSMAPTDVKPTHSHPGSGTSFRILLPSPCQDQVGSPPSAVRFPSRNPIRTSGGLTCSSAWPEVAQATVFHETRRWKDHG